jgi:hypothetical protein
MTRAIGWFIGHLTTLLRAFTKMGGCIPVKLWLRLLDVAIKIPGTYYAIDSVLSLIIYSLQMLLMTILEHFCHV